MNDNYEFYGISVGDILFNFKKMDALLEMEKQKLDICLIGGTACILTGLINRATIDYDLLNLDYKPEVRNYLNFFNPYDLVDFEATTIPRSYNERLSVVFQGGYICCRILCIEDLILSKLCRNFEKDFRDIDILIEKADKDKVVELIKEVKADIKTRYPRIQENYEASIEVFENRYHVHLNQEGI